MGHGTASTPGSERFRSLVETVPGIVVYLDVVQPDDATESLPVYISPQIEDLLGYPHEAWLNEDELWLDVLHPDDRGRMVEADTRARAELSSLNEEYRMIARDGRVVWVSEKAAVVTDAGTGTSYWQGVMVDITDRKQAEERQEASERKYRTVFDAATIGLLTVALDGTVLEANHAVEQVLGYPEGALVGAALWAGVDAATRVKVDAICAGESDRCELELELRRWNGVPLWCRTVLALVRDTAGRPDRITAMIEDIDERKRLEADLLHRTTHDSLTMLPNRDHFYARLGEAHRAAGAFGVGLGVVFIDLDDFKDVNDSYGHDAGDDLLRAVAARLRAGVRPSDVVARYGGDEFLVLVDSASNAHDVAQLAWRLASALRAPFEIGGATMNVSASFGVSFSGDADEPDEDLVRKADAAMYAAKRPGSNPVVVFGEHGSAGAAA